VFQVSQDLILRYHIALHILCVQFGDTVKNLTVSQ